MIMRSMVVEASPVLLGLQSQYSVAPNFRRVLAPTLQHMVETGRLDTDEGPSAGKHSCRLSLVVGSAAPRTTRHTQVTENTLQATPQPMLHWGP
jgi:hypothetical protein